MLVLCRYLLFKIINCRLCDRSFIQYFDIKYSKRTQMHLTLKMKIYQKQCDNILHCETVFSIAILRLIMNPKQKNLYLLCTTSIECSLLLKDPTLHFQFQIHILKHAYYRKSTTVFTRNILSNRAIGIIFQKSKCVFRM